MQGCILGYGSQSQNPSNNLNVLQQKDDRLWNIYGSSLNTKKNEVKMKEYEVKFTFRRQESVLRLYPGGLRPFGSGRKARTDAPSQMRSRGRRKRPQCCWPPRAALRN